MTQATTASLTPTGSGTPSGTLTPSQTLTRSGSGSPTNQPTGSQSGTPSASSTGSQKQTPSCTQSHSPSFSLRPLALTFSPTSAAPAAVSDSTPPVSFSLSLSRCADVELGALTLVCNARGADAGAGVVLYSALLGGAESPNSLCGEGGDAGASSGPVALPGSVVVGAAYGTAGGGGTASCELLSALGTSVAFVSTPLSVTPTLWPVWEDAIIVAASGRLFSTRLGYAVDGSAPLLAAACSDAAPRSLCNASLAAASGSLAVVLAAAQAAWGATPLPANGAGAPSSYALTLADSAVVVLRAPRRAFASNSSSFKIGGVDCPAAVSADGLWAALASPASRDLCAPNSATLECGYAAVTIANRAGSLADGASASGASRRAQSAAAAAPLSYRGASLSCPPFCPGAVGPDVAPVAADTAGSAFVLAVAPAASAAAAAAASAVSSSGGSTPLPSASTAVSSLGIYYAPVCVAPAGAAPYTDPLLGACANASSPLSSLCAYGTGESCQVGGCVGVLVGVAE